VVDFQEENASLKERLRESELRGENAFETPNSTPEIRNPISKMPTSYLKDETRNLTQEDEEEADFQEENASLKERLRESERRASESEEQPTP